MTERSLRVLLVNNQGGDGPERIKTRLLPGHNVDTVSIDYLIPDHYDGHDLIVLSGGSRNPANTKENTFQHEIALIKDAVVPIFGVCLGMQVIVHALDGEIKRMEQPRDQLVLPVTLTDDDPLTEGLGEILVYQKHKRAVTGLSNSMRSLGSSIDGIEVVRHVEKPIVGVQFHPERDGDFPTQGRVIFDRFMKHLVYES